LQLYAMWKMQGVLVSKEQASLHSQVRKQYGTTTYVLSVFGIVQSSLIFKYHVQSPCLHVDVSMSLSRPHRPSRRNWFRISRLATIVAIGLRTMLSQRGEGVKEGRE
jgi:hypothetical protein